MKRNLSLLLVLLYVCNISCQIPAGYYHYADGCKKEILLENLHNIVSKGKMLRYGGSGAGYTWAGFYHTDRQVDGQVIDMYSAIVRYQEDSTSVDGMHIEHSFPKSWWGGHMNNAYKDLHHLYPSDGRTNSTKNNLPLGEVCEATFDNGVSKVGPNYFGSYIGRCFEPADEFKGDFARAYFYIATAYNELSETWSSPMLQNQSYRCFTPWAIDLLLKWHREDPVSSKELNRQEQVYAIQGNRNPYIDYPELIEHIWGNDTTSNFTLPQSSQAYLLEPNDWTNINYGVQLLGSDKTHSILNIEGYNLTDTLFLNLISTDSLFTISRATLLPSANQSITDTITLHFDATIIGVYYDTLILNSSCLGNDIRIPLQINLVDQFMTLAPEVEGSTKATLNWMQHNDFQNYGIVLTEGAGQTAGNLFFSAYIEGSSWNKALELFNGTTQPIELSNYTVAKQNNGNGDFMGHFRLNGTLAPGQTYLIVNGSATSTLLSQNDTIAGNDQTSLVSFNGNDAIALFHNGVLIDLIGILDSPDYWGENTTLERKTYVTHPNPNFEWEEWISHPNDYYGSVKSHTLIPNSTIGYSTSYTATTNELLVNNLKPNSYYYYQVYGVDPTTGDTTSTVNSVQFKTEALETPLLFEAVDIFKSQFTISWEDVPEYDHYLLDLFTIDSVGVGSWSENFDDVGTNGKPLPTGWTGTASGNYTTPTSSGISPNSLGLKNNGEYLQTPNATSPIRSVSFMYRYPSAAANSNFTLKGFDGNNWHLIDSIPYVNTSKVIKSYQFNNSQNIESLKWTYNKASGNLALDDIEIIFGEIDSTFILHNHAMFSNPYIAEQLLPNTEYAYRIRTVLDTDTSLYSHTLYATTNDIEAEITYIKENTIFHFNTQQGIEIVNLKENTTAYIYSISGMLINTVAIKPGHCSISLQPNQMYFIKLVGNNNITTLKVIR